jgi:hypothetical protein
MLFIAPNNVFVCLLHSLVALLSSQLTHVLFMSYPFQLQKQAGQPHFQLKLCTPQLGEIPVKIFH